MATSSQHPAAFISYSWSSPEHEDFVVSLATRLRENGIDVRLDKWDLKEGQDKYAFMESMVTDSAISKVLVICDAKYMAKADGRVGGVGTESQIISAEIYGKVKQDKFLPIVVEYDDAANPCLPTFMASRIYIDLSNDDVFGDGFDQLLRAIYDKPRYKRPGLGSPPEFEEGETEGAVPVREFNAMRRAIEDGKQSAEGLEAQYTKAMLAEVSKLLEAKSSPTYDDEIVSSINRSRPCRDQFDQYIALKTCFYPDDPTKFRRATNLLEGVFRLCNAPDGMNSYQEQWFDVFRFLSWEFILLITAGMIREGAWASLDALCSETFVVQRSGSERLRTFASFDCYLESLDRGRNQRLQLNRVSVTTDLLHDRAHVGGTKFEEMMQADLFLSLRSLLHSDGDGYGSDIWFPRTLLYSRRSGEFPLFLKAESAATRKGLHRALGVVDGADFGKRFEQAAATHENFQKWRFDFQRIDVRALANVEALSL
jgi:hypothetical protein